MAKFRVTYQVAEESEAQEHFDIDGEVFCDRVLQALGGYLLPNEPWPFAVAVGPMQDDADITERAVRMHRMRAACLYLNLTSISYLIEGKTMEVVC